MATRWDERFDYNTHYEESIMATGYGQDMLQFTATSPGGNRRDKETRLRHYQSELSAAKERVAQLEEKIAKVEAEPDDDYPNGTYLIVESAPYPSGAPGGAGIYRKIRDRWYTQSGTTLVWEQMLQVMDGKRVTYQVVEMSEIS